MKPNNPTLWLNVVKPNNPALWLNEVKPNNPTLWMGVNLDRRTVVFRSHDD